MSNKLNPNNWLRGLALAFIITLILLTVVALLIRFTNIRESYMTLLNNLVLTASIVLSSAVLARRLKERGWLNGAIVGFSYYFIIIILQVYRIRCCRYLCKTNCHQGW